MTTVVRDFIIQDFSNAQSREAVFHQLNGLAASGVFVGETKIRAHLNVENVRIKRAKKEAEECDDGDQVT